MKKTVLNMLLERYPQLRIPVGPKEVVVELYNGVVLKGIEYDNNPDFVSPDGFTIEAFETPAGSIDIVTVFDRNDFEHVIKCICYKCEDKPVPASMGAVMLDGLINRAKINDHMKEYANGGGNNAGLEFKLFTMNKANYTDRLIILGKTPYSNVSFKDIGYPEETWLEKSYIIRKYHELSHFISRKLFPENRDAIRDELVADGIGLFAAFGHYDKTLAMLFLGIENGSYRNGGRLENYLDVADDLKSVIDRALLILDALQLFFDGHAWLEPFEMLISIEKEGIAMD